jgi:hypothetical protein
LRYQQAAYAGTSDKVDEDIGITGLDVEDGRGDGRKYRYERGKRKINIREKSFLVGFNGAFCTRTQ